MQSDVSEHLRYRFDGMVEGLSDRGRYTIELLNLNQPKLLWARKYLMREIASHMDDKDYIEQVYLTPVNGRLPQFAGMLQQFYDEGVFDG